MYILEKLILINFGPHKNTTYNFIQGIPTFIEGNNKTDEGQLNNGTGKSFIEEGVASCIIGSSLKGVRDVDLIMDGQKEAQSYLSMFNTKTKRRFTIQKIITKTGSTYEIEINGESQSDKIPGVPEAKKFILDELDISREDLVNYFIISRDKYKSFFSSSDTAKKDLVSRFSGAQKVVGLDKTVQAKVDTIQKDIDLKLAKIEAQESILEEYNNDLEKENNIDVEEIRQQRINNVNSGIVNLSNDNKIHEGRIDSNNLNVGRYKKSIETEKSNIENFEKEIVLLDKIDYSTEITELNEKIGDYQAKIDKNNTFITNTKLSIQTPKQELKVLKKDLSTYQTALEEVQANIEGGVECPECSHVFLVGDKEFDISEAKENLPIYQEGIKELEESISNKENSISTKEDLISTTEDKNEEFESKIEGLETKVSNLETKQKNKEKDKVKINDNINDCNDEIERLNGLLSNIKVKNKTEQSSIDSNLELIKEKEKEIEKIKDEEIENNNIEAVKTKIKNKEKEIKELNKELKALQDDKFEKEKWVYYFKEFYSHLANKAIKGIEGYANIQLKKMKTNLRVQLEGYKTTAKGELREKIESFIYKDGELLGVFGKGSAGERGRIEIAQILAIQQLINNRSKSGGLNLCFIDEVLNDVDSLGLQNIGNSLKGLDYCVNIITQNTMYNGSDYRVLTVEKINNISHVREKSS